MLTEEALELPHLSALLEQLRGQPAWSELPLNILTCGGESRFVRLLDLAATAAGGVTLLERPIGAATLLRSVEVALRSRRRQYQVRDLLASQARLAGELKAQALTLEQTVAERTRELRATNEQLEAFVYSIAHDLRAPLRSMGAYAQLLVEDYGAGLEEEAARNLLKRIQASSEFMDKLLLDLLAYGRTARAEMELAPVDVQNAWETALFQCATQIESTGVRVETAAPLPRVRAHEATLGQCLANLLSNALKFVAPGVPPRVRFWSEAQGGQVRLWVADNGIGIAREHQERAFRVFERLHGAHYPGTGVGLSIVRKGVERMGGSLGLESDTGQGCRFWIE